MSISYDVKHFQEVLINIKKVESLEQKIKNLEDEKIKLKLDKNKLEKKFTGFCQDLVNHNFLEFGKEPYACEQCNNIVSGVFIIYSYIDKDNYTKYICNKCCRGWQMAGGEGTDITL